jgi:exonuclease SbcC
MRITQVALTDIKSYEDRTEIPLTGGVTAILGENGAGKSTVQEAIGYALFDSLPFVKKDFVREGASSGCVEVTFEQTTAEGSETYRVQRYAGRSKYEVARQVGEEWVDQGIDSKSSLVEWLCARFGLADGEELSDLWKSCIGVPQTRFLADFAQTRGDRTDTFDALLDIDAYEDSYAGTLKSVPDVIEDERAAVRRDVQELTGEVQALPDRRATVADFSAEIASLETRIEKTERDIQETEERYDELAAIEERIHDHEGELRTAKNEVESSEDALETARGELSRARTAQQQVEAARSGHERYLDAEERENALKERESDRDELREQERNHEEEIRLLVNEAEGLETDVETYQSAVTAMEELADAKQRHDEVNERIQEAEQTQKTIETLESDVEDVVGGIKDTIGDLAENHEDVRRIESKRENAPDVEELESQLGDAKAERTALGTERSRLNEELERLRDTDVDAACPTCGQALSPEHRRDTIAEREARLDEIDDDRAALTEQIETLQDQLDAARAVQRQVDTLPFRYDQRDELAERLQELKDKRKAIREERDTLEADLADLSELRATRNELAEDQKVYLRAETRAEDTADAEADLKATRKRIEDERDALADTEDDLSVYEDLDEQLADVRHTLQETEDDHDTFVQHRQQAAQVEDREETVEQLETDLEAAEATREEHAEALAAAREEFDPEEYAAVEERITGLTSNLGGYRDRKQTREEDRKKAEAEVERLEGILDERSEMVHRLKELAADQRFATWIRENVRAAGPKMRDVITDRISERANQLFRTIRGQPAETLEWTSDYEIVVSDAGVRKSFETLSGGEQMAAALAVRLAILEQLSGIGVAFLDEPTANLDAEKKANLVEQLDRLDAFEQLTVISHDTTFETMTDYAVTVTKDRQTTEVSVD